MTDRAFPETMHDLPMTLSEQDRQMLTTALHNKKPEVVQARMANAILLLAEGLPAGDVAGLLYMDETTILGWQKIFAGRRAA